MSSKRKREPEVSSGRSKKPKITSNDPSISTLISQPMTIPERKALLKQLQNPTAITTLRRPELLLDFCTDSLSHSDISIAVPALTALYHLIKHKNLDYPSFYTRLYTLLTPTLLCSTHRSRLLRHLDTFLNPTNHLSASLVASFIKRLSRLSLFAPPSSTVAIIPLIYNLLQTYPSTTFMIHRKPYPPYTSTRKNLGVDPYDASEEDPHLTNAISSSLWELETLQSHYHPTVSQIARIISEQFTKQSYNLEDFLDHGYATMMESELGRESKKDPVVEYKIPKRIFFADEDEVREDENRVGDLLRELWDFS